MSDHEKSIANVEEPASIAAADAEAASRKASLDRSLVSGIVWTGGMRGITQAFQWVAALVVVRLLTPADYGLVGMATAYLGLVRMLSEFGLGAAIIQHRHLTRAQIAHIAGVSILFALGFALVSVAASGLVADFFREPLVQPIIIVLSVTFVLGGLDVVPRSLLKRDLRFKHLAWVQAAENLSYAAATLILAARGFGYWALVYGAVAGSAVRAIVALASRWHPIEFPRAIESIREELIFGWHVIASRFALYVRQFADVVIVGRVLGREPLGAYTVAWTQSNIAVDRVTALVSEVTPSVLSAAQNDIPALRRYLRIVTEGIAFLTFPATIGLAIIADDFVLLVFGEQWRATIAPLRALALVGSLRSITPILSQVLIALDQAKKNMQFTVSAALILPLFLLVGTRWGIAGVATAWLIGHPLIMVPTLLRQTLRAVDMPMRDYLRVLQPAAIATAATAVAVLAVRAGMPGGWPLWTRFAVEVGVGVAVYAGGVMLTYRSRLAAFVSLMRSARNRKSRPASN